MSADNGIYILQTYGPEYRIVYVHAIDNIFGRFDESTHHFKGDTEMILRYFGEAPVYTDLEQAWDDANKMAEDYDWLEDGVCLIKDYSEYTFSDIIDGKYTK